MASIIVIDDDDDTRDTMADLLSLEGHQIRTGRNGVEGLQALDVELPQLVVTDIEMPILDGFEMIHRMFIENLGRENIPVILASGAADLHGIAEAVGTPYFLTKPFAFEALVGTIERALAEAIPPRPPSCWGR